MNLLPVKTEMDFRDRREKINVPEITDLLRYWMMLERNLAGKHWSKRTLNFKVIES